MLQYEYAREALKNGLKLESEFGTNPYKFGMVGSSDSHTALAAVEEENYIGKHAGTEPAPGRWDHPMAKFAGRQYDGWAMSASGYAKGVPMGGELFQAPEGKSPTFLLAAMKDPLSGNLDRIQIVKGWLDKKGETHEKVYDVAWGDAETRKPGKDGKVPAVGNTVDVENATWTNTIGDPELITVWVDPDFDASVKAFYYARVLEIPTPRWTAYDAKRYGVKVDPEVPMFLQERAYTSPIWYSPDK